MFAQRLYALAEQYQTPIFIGPVGDDPGVRTIGEAFPRLIPSDQEAAPPLTAQVGVNKPGAPSFNYSFADLEKDGPPRLQAAYALYRALCARRDELCRDAPAAVERRFEGRELAVAWGFGAPQEMAGVLPPEFAGRCIAGTPGQRFLLALKELWLGLMGVAADGTPIGSGCTYHLTVPARAVMQFSNAAEDSRADAALTFSDLFADRAVLIGADVAALSDFVETPVYGESPGVVGHAMALDNLIERGARAAIEPQGFLLGIDRSDLLETILLMTALFAIYLIGRGAGPGAALERQDVWGGYLTVVLVTVAAGLLLGWLNSWPPVNILSIALSLLGAAALVDVLCVDPSSSDETRKG